MPPVHGDPVLAETQQVYTDWAGWGEASSVSSAPVSKRCQPSRQPSAPGEKLPRGSEPRASGIGVEPLPQPLRHKPTLAPAATGMPTLAQRDRDVEGRGKSWTAAFSDFSSGGATFCRLSPPNLHIPLPAFAGAFVMHNVNDWPGPAQPKDSTTLLDGFVGRAVVLFFCTVRPSLQPWCRVAMSFFVYHR
jgi:hypothetical protein